MTTVYKCKVDVQANGARVGSGTVYAAGADVDEAKAIAAQALYDHGLWGDGLPDRSYEVVDTKEVSRREVPTSDVIYEADILPAPRP